MANNVQYMNGKSLGIGAFLPSTVGERFNAVERSSEEHEAAVLMMIDRAENKQDLWTGDELPLIGFVDINAESDDSEDFGLDNDNEGE